MSSIAIDDVVRLSDEVMQGLYFTPDCDGIVTSAGLSSACVEWADGRIQHVPKNNLTVVREEMPAQNDIVLPDDMRRHAEREGVLTALRKGGRIARTGKRFLLHSDRSPLVEAVNDLAAAGIVSIHEIGIQNTLRIELEES